MKCGFSRQFAACSYLLTPHKDFGLWADIDWATKTIYIQRAAQEVRGEVELTEPKSKRGIRRVPLADVTVSALRQRQKAALAEGQAANEQVFTDGEGGIIRRSNFHNRHWDPLRKRLLEKGVPYVRFHDLRHTAATMWLRENVHAKIVQEWLGHATVAFTLGVFGHARRCTERLQSASTEPSSACSITTPSSHAPR